MLFNSFYYFLFLGMLLVIYYAVQYRFRNLILLLASLFFIGYIAPQLIIFTLLFSVLNYFTGLGLVAIKTKQNEKDYSGLRFILILEYWLFTSISISYPKILMLYSGYSHHNLKFLTCRSSYL